MVLQDNQPLQIWVTILLFVVPMIALSLRLYVRLKNKTRGLDDALMAIGAFFYIFQCTTVIGGAVAGIGLQTEHITDQATYIAAGKWFFFNILAYSTAAGFVRLSILVTLLRIVTRGGYKYSIYVAMAAIIAVALQGIIFVLVQCQPISWYWDKYSGEGSCVSSTAIRANTIVTNFTIAVTDVFSAVLPIMVLWNIQMNLRSKILVCIMLTLGALAAITIVVRLPAIVDLQDHEDSLYSVSVSILWGTAETGIGITAASISSLRPLFRSWIGGTSYAKSKSNNYALGTMPGNKGRFNTTFRPEGMSRLSDTEGGEGGRGEGKPDVSDHMLSTQERT
ncbi:hypothetical protein BX600DRAFT_100554 [Xylariales sp. PMI_506]|nr:hypothetical protein BX600DRAFT_100554 [Xylariales sp. PMI_506]